MKFEIFLLKLIGICFAALTSVAGASPLDTIPPPITDFFIPVNQRSVEPVRNPGDFIGRVFAPKPEDWQTRPEAQPITGVTVTIASGPRSGESVATNPSGFYRFPNVKEDELHLRVEKEHFEPKEVMVHRSRPTILANGDVPNYTRDPQQHPGNILIGHRWPDEVRFILEEVLVVHDLLYVEGGRPPEGVDLGGFYSLGVVVIYSYQFADWKDIVGLLGTFAHEIAHAHQHATVSVDGSAWEIHGWKDTPEGRAYEEAQKKDWEQVGKSPLDDIYGGGHGGGVALTETAAETCAHYWSVDRWGGRTAYGLLEVEAPNRYRWAEKWVPVTIAVRPPPKVVSIPDQNLAAAIRKALGLEENARITQQAMQRVTELDARKSEIENLTGLEHAVRLRRLELRENQIFDISPLANLTNLNSLILDQNKVRDITPLMNMTQLTWLLIGGNGPNIDITPLQNMTNLRGLSLYRNQISDVSPLQNLTNLTRLWLGSNQITDISPLASLTNLEWLELWENTITDISPLASLTDLKDLHFDDNTITDISPLSNLTKLTYLRLRNNQITNVSALVNLVNLAELYLKGNPIQDFSPLRTLLANNPGLKIDIDINQPGSLDVDGDGQITVIDLAIVALFYGTQVPAGMSLPADVNADLVVDILDLTAVAQGIDAAGGIQGFLQQEIEAALLAVAEQAAEIEAIAEAPNASSRGNLAYHNVAAALTDAKHLATSDVHLKKGVRVVLEELLQLLTEMKAIPETSALLPNYPNPFNPETWIPYQLAKAADVTLTIYAVDGTVVRQLVLGHQPIGIYQGKSRAAYWDGRNAQGELVASGVYFYTLTAGEFTATRKMLIKK